MLTKVISGIYWIITNSKRNEMSFKNEAEAMLTDVNVDMMNEIV